MSLIQTLIVEIEREVDSTEKLLNCIPAEKFDWQPHEKSMTLKHLASHTASLSRWITLIVKASYYDFEEGGFKKTEINSVDDLINELHEATKGAVESLKSVKDSDLSDEWLMKRGDKVFHKFPKGVAIRHMGMNHLYHHRGQLSVYLRLLNVPIPGMYGASADDKEKVAKA